MIADRRFPALVFLLPADSILATGVVCFWLRVDYPFNGSSTTLAAGLALSRNQMMTSNYLFLTTLAPAQILRPATVGVHSLEHSPVTELVPRMDIQLFQNVYLRFLNARSFFSSVAFS